MMHRSKGMPFDQKEISQAIKTFDLLYKIVRVNVEAPSITKKTTTVRVLDYFLQSY